MQTCDEILEDSERLIQQYHNTNTGAMTQIALAPCSPFSVSEIVMRESAKLAENAGGGILLEGTRIIELIRSGKQPTSVYDSVFDASCHIILPGLINLHHHF